MSLADFNRIAQTVKDQETVSLAQLRIIYDKMGVLNQYNIDASWLYRDALAAEAPPVLDFYAASILQTFETHRQNWLNEIIPHLEEMPVQEQMARIGGIERQFPELKAWRDEMELQIARGEEVQKISDYLRGEDLQPKNEPAIENLPRSSFLAEIEGGGQVPQQELPNMEELPQSMFLRPMQQPQIDQTLPDLDQLPQSEADVQAKKEILTRQPTINTTEIDRGIEPGDE